MKVLIVFTSLFAFTFASGWNQGHYPINIPVIGKTGVPLESAEIVHARHAHLSQVAAVKSLRGDGGAYYNNELGYAGAGLGYAGAGLGYAGAGLGYAGAAYGGYALPVIGHNGVPIDTPEVQAAKAAHFAAYAKAAAASSYGGQHYRKRRSIYGYAVPIIGKNGVPIDTPEVQAARAAHFAAHAKAGSGLGGAYGGAGYGAGYGSGLGGAYGSAGYGAGYGSGYGGYYGGYAKIGHDGQPIETPEVQALKSKHFAALAEAASRAGAGYGGYGYSGAASLGYGAAGYGAAGYGYAKGPIHIPVIGPKGVPIDTPEVQHARQQHFAALAKASSQGGYY